MSEKKKELILPVSIECGFTTLEQKLIFEALVVPEIKKVLLEYAPLLGYAGLTENTESEEN